MLQSILVVCYLFSFVFTKMSLIEFPESPISSKDLECLQRQGYIDTTFIQGLNLFGNFQMSVQFSELQNAGITPHLVIYNIDNVFPEVSASRWVKYLSSRNYASIWVSIIAPQGIKVKCQEIWKLTSTLASQLKQTVGVYINGNQYQWPNDYYETEFCRQLGIFPLFLEQKDQFEPFANWNTWTLKTGEMESDVCGISGDVKEVIVNK